MTAATKQDIVKAFMLFAKYVKDPKYKGMQEVDVWDDIARRIVKELENNNV